MNLPTHILLPLALGAVLVRPVAAHPPEDGAPAKESDKAENVVPKQGAEEPIPSLDELLGLPGEKKDESAPAGTDELDPTKSALERKLTAQELEDAFLQAVALMGDTAARLERARDPGLTTQRLQEEILKRLDTLIENAQESQSQSQSQSQQQQQQGQQQPRQQRQSSSAQSPSPTDDPSEQGQRPGGEADPLRETLDAKQAAWGSLPDRLRDALSQGWQDPYSSLYRSLTEDYYRRLAEEGRDE